MRERSFRSVWISDVHLGNADCRAAWLLEFLDACRCEQLYLVGDVLDLWEMDRAHSLHPWTNFGSFEKEGSLVIARGEGCYLWDAEGRRYLEEEER